METAAVASLEHIRMPPKPRRTGEPTDPVRALILAKSEEKGISQGYLSEALGYNPAYMNQFIRRGSPRNLAPEDAEVIANILGLKASQLINSEKTRRGSRLSPIGSAQGKLEVLRSTTPTVPQRIQDPDAAATATAAGGQEARQGGLSLVSSVETVVPPAPRSISPESGLIEELVGTMANRDAPPRSSVPLYRDDEEINAEALAIGRRAMFSLWVTLPRNRVRPGDIVVASGEAVPRPGDLVVAVRDNRVIAIGELKYLSRTQAVVLESADPDDGGETIDRENARLFKVVSAQFA